MRHALRLEPEERIQRSDIGGREVLRVVELAVRVVLARADRREDVVDLPLGPSGTVPTEHPTQ